MLFNLVCSSENCCKSYAKLTASISFTILGLFSLVAGVVLIILVTVLNSCICTTSMCQQDYTIFNNCTMLKYSENYVYVGIPLLVTGASVSCGACSALVIICYKCFKNKL